MTGKCGTHSLALTPTMAKAPAKNTTGRAGVHKLNAMADKQAKLISSYAGGGQSGGGANDSGVIHTTDPVCPEGFYKMAASPNPGAAEALVNSSQMNQFKTTGGGRHVRSRHKRSRHKRSRHKRSRHKRSRHKRSRHKRSRHKRSRHKRSRRHRSKSSR